MIQSGFVSIKDITVHNPEPMLVPAIYVCNEFTKLKHYSAINLLSKCHPQTSALGILHKMVKRDEMFQQKQ